MFPKKISPQLLTIISFIVFFILLSYITLYTSGDTFDEFIFLEGAKRILAGQIIYKDFFSFLPPGLYYLIAGLWKIFGQQYLYVRLLTIFINFIICIFIYQIYKKFINKYLSLLSVLIFIIFFLPLQLNIYHHWAALLAILIATFFFLKYLEQLKNKYLAYTGLTLGFGSLFLHTTIAYVFTGTLIFLLFCRGKDCSFKKNVSICLYFLGWFALPLILVMPYFIATAGWPTIWNDLIINNLLYYPHINYLPLYKNWLFFINLISLIIASSILFKNKIIKDSRLLFLYIISLIMFASSLYRLDLGHQAYTYMAFSLLLVFYVTPYLAWRPAKRLSSLLLSVCLLSPLISNLFFSYNLTYLNRNNWEKIPSTAIGDVFVSVARAPSTKTIISTVKKLDSSKILIYPFLPLYYTILDIKNPSRFTLIEDNYMSEADKTILKQDIINNQVDYIIYNPFERSALAASPLSPSWLEENFPNKQVINYPGTNEYFFLYSKK